MTTRHQRPFELELLQEGFKIELVHGREATEYCCICDEKFVSRTYERLALEHVDMDNFIGIFIRSEGDGILVATAIVEYDIRKSTCILHLLCTNPLYRRGFGSRLIRYIITKAGEYGLHRVSLLVSRGETNQHAVSFYEQFGFERIRSGGENYKYELLI